MDRAGQNSKAMRGEIFTVLWPPAVTVDWIFITVRNNGTSNSSAFNLQVLVGSFEACVKNICIHAKLFWVTCNVSVLIALQSQIHPRSTMQYIGGKPAWRSEVSRSSRMASPTKFEGIYDFTHKGGTFDVHLRPGNWGTNNRTRLSCDNVWRSQSVIHLQWVSVRVRVNVCVLVFVNLRSHACECINHVSITRANAHRWVLFCASISGHIYMVRDSGRRQDYAP